MLIIDTKSRRFFIERNGNNFDVELIYKKSTNPWLSDDLIVCGENLTEEELLDDIEFSNTVAAISNDNDVIPIEDVMIVLSKC